MKNDSNKLSLDRPAAYQIKVPGHLDKSWTYLVDELTIAVDYDEGGLPITLPGALKFSRFTPSRILKARSRLNMRAPTCHR